MIGIGQNTALRMFAACALLFVAAQTVAFAHSFEHDTGVSQSQACATCVAAGQMSSACVDHTPIDSPASLICHLEPGLAAMPVSVDTVAYHQRGPPPIP